MQPALPIQPPPPGSLRRPQPHIRHHALGTQQRIYVSDAEPLLLTRLITPPNSLAVKRTRCTGAAPTCVWITDHLRPSSPSLSSLSLVPLCWEHIFRVQCCCSSPIRRLWLCQCCGQGLVFGFSNHLQSDSDAALVAKAAQQQANSQGIRWPRPAPYHRRASHVMSTGMASSKINSNSF